LPRQPCQHHHYPRRHLRRCHRRHHRPRHRRLPVTLVPIALVAITIALLVARHPCHQLHPSRHCPLPLCYPPPSFPSPSPCSPSPSLPLPSSSAACSCCSSLPTIVVVWLPCQRSLASHHPFLPILLLVDCCSPSVPIALVAIACLPPSTPLLLPQLLLPSSLHATLIDAMARAALTLFVDRHPHCCHHCPCHPCPLRYYHHHPPHTLVDCRHPLSWSCGRLVDALLPATARLCCSHRQLIVVII
jgi:hypothetical protein